jgi:hypothetical protein
MTDTTTETVGPDTEAEGWGADAPAVTYPEYSDRPHNHNFTISLDGRGPMVAIRAQTAEEFNARLQELEDAGTLTMVASVYSHMKAEMAIAQGLGPVTPVGPPQGAPAPVQPMPLPQSPQAQYPAGPPVPPQGPAPAQWQNAGAPAPQAGPQNQEYRNAGWYRLDVPFPKKGQFDGIVAQYQLRKGRPSEGGSYSFNSKGEKAWYVSPEVAGAFPMFSPVPA